MRPEVIVHQLTAIGAVDLRHMERDFAPANVCGPRGSCCATAGSTGRAPRSCPASPPWSLTTAAFGESGGEARQNPDRVALWGNSLGGAHIVSVAADDPRSSPWSPRFPSTASLDGSRVARPLPPFASSGPSSGRQRHDTVEERGRASRAPPDDALPARVGCSPTTGTPARVRCGAGPGDAGPQRPGARPGRPSRHATDLPGDALRLLHRSCHPDRALADQLDFLYQHLQASPKVA